LYALYPDPFWPSGAGIRGKLVIRGGDADAQSTDKTKIGRLRLPDRTAGPLSVHTASARVVGPGQGRSHSTERRNLTSRTALLRRITVEYDEMPGLCLTAAQAQRLFGLRDDICSRVLNALVNAAAVRRDLNGLYTRSD
jgi:hypothetical protein